MKPFNYYNQPRLSYPNKKDYITLYVYDKGECICEEKSGSATGSITKSHLNQKYPNAVIQEVLDKEAYQADKTKYNLERNKLHQEFKDDLFEDYGVSDNPKRFLLYDTVVEHKSEYEEIYDFFGELVELIRE